MDKNFPSLNVFDAFARPHVCGHRGHSITGHENSRTALRLAAQHGATMCEIDLRLTADGAFVVFHDEILDELSTGQGFVGQYDLATLQNLRYRLRNEGSVIDDRLLSFPQILEEAKGLGLCLMVELKDTPTDAGQFNLLEQNIRDAAMMERVIIISFDFQMLKYLGDAHPVLPTLGIVHGNHVNPVAIAKEAALDVYSVDYPHFTADTADALHAAGIRTGHFIPRPAFFEQMGARGKEKLSELADYVRSGKIDILGCDDVEWLRIFVDHALRSQNTM